MINVVIIDDEQPARMLINSYLSEFDDFEVVAECANGFEGMKAIQEFKPDLIFLDIKMPKISGFEMLELLDDPPYTIFSTAYDDQAIKAFELNAIDYLLKPYSKDRFNQAVNKALKLIEKGEKTSREKIREANRTVEEGTLSRIVVKNGSQIEIIPLTEINFIEAMDDYISIVTPKGKFLKQLTMKILERQLPESEFLRVHRSFILKLDNIRVIEPMTRDSYIAVLKSGEKVPVSKKGYRELKNRLNI